MTEKKPLRRLNIGDWHASDKGVVLQTLLGSCVSVCLYDPVARVGGMNHIFLPGTQDLARSDPSARLGVNAMRLLTEEIVRLGGQPRRLRAKVFGGAQLLSASPEVVATGTLNARFVDAYLAERQIPVLARDLGGTDTRVLQFRTDTGDVLLRRVFRDRMLQAEVRHAGRVHRNQAAAKTRNRPR